MKQGAQTSVAVINQVWSLQDGKDWNGTYVKSGQVDAANLTCYHHHIYDNHKDQCEGPELTHGIAHAYGEYAYGSLTRGIDCGPYTDTADIIRSRTKPGYYCRRISGQQEFAYRFMEYNPTDQQRTYPYLTNRVITASANQCSEYAVTNVQSGTTTGKKWTVYTINDTSDGDISLPVQIDTFDGTAYIYRGFKVPQEATTWSCGKRCIWMWAHKTARGEEPSAFYKCAVTVGTVIDAKQKEHIVEKVHAVGDDMARIAASAIGLQGGKSDHDNGWMQSSFYPFA